MTILSFAHLKGKKPADASPPAPAPQPTPLTPVQDAPPQPRIRVQSARGIGTMKTALLAAVNYCDGCPRFWPSDDNEKAQGVPYGRCCRDDKGEYEVWRSIPLTATVAKCWYHQQEIPTIDQYTYTSPIKLCEI